MLLTLKYHTVATLCQLGWNEA